MNFGLFGPPIPFSEWLFRSFDAQEILSVIIVFVSLLIYFKKIFNAFFFPKIDILNSKSFFSLNNRHTKPTRLIAILSRWFCKFHPLCVKFLFFQVLPHNNHEIEMVKYRVLTKIHKIWVWFENIFLSSL